MAMRAKIIMIMLKKKEKQCTLDFVSCRKQVRGFVVSDSVIVTSSVSAIIDRNETSDSYTKDLL